MINLLLTHIQKTRTDVTWIRKDKTTGDVTYDVTLPDHASIELAISLYDESASLSSLTFKNMIKDGETERKEIIKQIKADIAEKLYQDLPTFAVKMDELKAFINSAGLHIFNYLMSSLPNDLIAYTINANTLLTYPVLNDEYETGLTIANFIVGEL